MRYFMHKLCHRIDEQELKRPVCLDGIQKKFLNKPDTKSPKKIIAISFMSRIYYFSIQNQTVRNIFSTFLFISSSWLLKPESNQFVLAISLNQFVTVHHYLGSPLEIIVSYSNLVYTHVVGSSTFARTKKYFFKLEGFKVDNLVCFCC